MLQAADKGYFRAHSVLGDGINYLCILRIKYNVLYLTIGILPRVSQSHAVPYISSTRCVYSIARLSSQLILFPFCNDEIGNSSSILNDNLSRVQLCSMKLLSILELPSCVYSNSFLSRLFGSLHKSVTLNSFRHNVIIVQSLPSSNVLSATTS